MSYAAEHTSARADIRAAGTDVVFTLAASAYSQSTDVETSAASVTLSGVAIRVKGRPDMYRPQTLIQEPTVNLLFAPDTYGDRPALNATTTWEGAPFTVVAVAPLAPDGTDILSHVGLA